MAYAVSAAGEPPFDIEMRAADPAGTAFQAAFVIDAYAVFFQFVNIGRADIETWLVLTLVKTHSLIQQAQVRFLIHIESIQKQLVLNFDAHRTLLHASHARRSKRSGETCPRIAF